MSKSRVLISTDLGGDDKDDAQSLIHALLYADEVDYRGVVSTLTDDPTADGAPHFRRIADAYERDLPDLQLHGDYPSAGKVRALYEEGSQNPSWPGDLTSGVELIIDEARAASPSDPLYLLGWGPIHDIARALYEAPDIVPNVRVISIAGHAQDKAHPQAFEWMREAVSENAAYRDLWWIDSAETFRGMYVGPNGQNEPSRNLDWTRDNVDGHGALGDLFHDTYAYDLNSGKSYTTDGLKMGDTPSLLYLLDSISDDNPGARSWGGSFRKNGLGPNTWSDKGGAAMGPYDGARTVFEHRAEAWGDFADRLDRAQGAPAALESRDEGAASPEARDEGGASAPDAAIVTGRTEVEDLALDGYATESWSSGSGGAVARIPMGGSGSAAGVFEGPAGRYEITVGYINEDDGASDWRLKVDGRTVTSWNGAGGSNGGERIAATVDLERGDAIVLEGAGEGLEFARLDWMEIGTAAASPAPASAPASAPAPRPRQSEDLDADLFVFAGQSNAAGHFFRRGGDNSGGDLGSKAFERSIESWTGEDARVVNAAVSGSGSNQHADRSDYWWDIEANRPGPELVRAVRIMRDAEASGRDVDAFIWAQGEDDARVVRGDGANLDVTMRRLDESTRAVFDHVRDALDDPDLPIFIQELGPFPQIGGWLDGPVGALDAMRSVQAKIARDMPDVHLGARTTDVTSRHDTIHFDNAAYGTIADRLADSVIDVFTDEFLL